MFGIIYPASGAPRLLNANDPAARCGFNRFAMAAFDATRATIKLTSIFLVFAEPEVPLGSFRGNAYLY